MPDPLNPLARTTGAAVVRPRSPTRGAGGAFVVPDGADARPTGDATAADALGAVNPMLLHELAVDADERRDREARQHGEDVLELLGELQRGLLRAGVETLPMERLLHLVENPPAAADPGLAAVTRAIVLRARIEIARRRAPGRPQD
jgi:hypothetical protein